MAIQRCALVQDSDEAVINLIVADPSVDPAPEGCTIIGIPDDSPVTFSWIYNPQNGTFTAPVET